MGSMSRVRRLALATVVVLLAAGSVVPSYATERAYLRSGSDLTYDHQKSLDGWIRLYLNPAEDSYLDIAPGDILRCEMVMPDPAALPSMAQNAVQPVRVTTDTFDLPTILGRAGAAHHLDPDLLASVVHAESGGQVRAVSHAGAQGLMQLMPKTAADLGVRDSFAPEQNVAGGAAYLDALLMYYHEDIIRALAAYNAGPAAVDRYQGIPPYAETRRYVARVIHDYNQRKLREARSLRHHDSPLSSIATVVAHP